MRAFSVALIALSVPLVMGYDEKYDKIDVDKILGDNALFDSYTACLLDKGPCQAENSAEFRKLLPEVISTACAKCTPIQRQHVRKSVKAIQERKPAEFEDFRKLYDPKTEYADSFGKFMAATD